MSFWEPLGELGGGSGGGGASLPDGPWPTGSPESQGVSAAMLATAPGIQHGVVIRHGVEIYTYGDAGTRLDWASCNRTWKNVMWGRWVQANGVGCLERWAEELPCLAASAVPNVGAALKHVASYTSLPPIGQEWRYSSGDWWPWQSRALAELNSCLDVAEAWALQVQPYLGGSTFQAHTADDGTLRVKASCRDDARLAALFLNGGLGVNGIRLMDEAYVTRSIAGGPDGVAFPFAWEGYQTHLIRQYRCNAGSSQNSPQWIDLPLVPDGFLALDGNEDLDHGWGAIVGIPSLDVIVAARGSTPAWWLPKICEACL